MLIDTVILFDLLRLAVNRSDERIKKLAESIFEIYGENIESISSAELKYCELYVSLCKEILGQSLNISDHKVDIVNIFKRALSNQIFRKDNYVKEALKSIIDDDVSPSRITDITGKLNNVVAWFVSKRYITKLYGHLKESSLSYSVEQQSNNINTIKSLVGEFKNTLIDIESISTKNGPVEVINMSDIESIKKAFKTYKERRVNYILRSGWQGLNMMMGPAGGAALGESLLFCARNHNYKSGILMKWAQWIASYTSPPPTYGKKPMILVISLENEGYQNMMELFKLLYVACNNHAIPTTMTDEDMVQSIYEYFDRSPYTLVVERYLPQCFGYEELVRLVENYENAGFRIISTIIDYIGLMRTHSSGTASRSGDHALLQNLYNQIVNYFKAVGTTIISVHQLNRDASNIAASGVPHRVKLYSERHLAGSTGIAREVDFLAYQEIEVDEQGRSWLTMNWAKHRYVDDTPDKHKFCCYQFSEQCGIGIPDDINGTFMGSRNIYKTKETKEATVADIDAILGGRA